MAREEQVPQAKDLVQRVDQGKSTIASAYASLLLYERRINGIYKSTEPFRLLIWPKAVLQDPFRFEPILVYRIPTARYNINDRIWTDVLPYTVAQAQERFHHDQNPAKLYEHLVGYLARRSVLDPFLGSGTTLHACKKLGKECIGFEKDQEMRPYIAVLRH
jgi:DNA modification methylase